MTKRLAIVMISLLVGMSSIVLAAEETALVDFKDLPEGRVRTSGKATYELTGEGDAAALVFTVEKDGYPGVFLMPKEEFWDLSAHGAVEFTVTNVGERQARVHGRLDNPGNWQQQPWNVNAQTLKPGDSKTIRVVFGQSYGNPAHDLDPAEIKQMLVFVEKPGGEAKIRIDSVKAVGKAAPKSEDSDDASAAATTIEGNDLLDVTAEGAAERFTPSCGQISVAPSTDPEKPGLNVTVAPGPEGYPGISLKAEDGGMLDLSKFGHVAMQVVNTSDQSYNLALRVDNNGDWKKNPWNTEGTWIKPGQNRTIKVIFGYHYGKKKGYDLDPSQVSQILIFTSKAKKELSFRLESLTVGGPAGEKPPVDPNSIRIKPQDTYLLGGGDVKLDADKQINPSEGVKVTAAEGANATFSVEFPKSKKDKANVIAFRPPIGRWDLTRASEVRIKVTNTGQTPITIGARAETDNNHTTDTVSMDAPLAPGATGELVVPFEASTSWQGPDHDVTKAHEQGKRGTGSQFASDKANTIRIYARHDGKASMKVDAIRATAEPVETPEWLGKRPPVEGDWTLTLDENFDGDSINLDIWRNTGPNWWGAKSKTHWSKDNLIVSDGTLKMHFEKKRGWHNDDPASGHQSDYAGGFFDSYGKWVQKYGYFESRMKLPVSPGLWPAFWLMPDRGPAAGEQWKRQDTAKGGMEFDIMEHLTRWGPYRYNIAMHWDGYGKKHKAVGSTNIYVQADKDGFITTGLLWLPGKAVFYCNGKEVARWENDRISNVESCILFTMPVGGWDNNALDDKQLPADFEIDYVRVWQRKDLGEPGGPPAGADASK